MKWTFPKADSGQIKGFNDEGIERFKGDPIKSLAREICQNSLDAWKDKSAPVRIEFSEFISRFPERESFVEQMNQMLEYWQPTQKHDKGVIIFLQKAIKLLQNNEEIPCLRISDFNTTGLTGIITKGSSWDNLIKRIGASDKFASDGGSRGIGKAAPFACSSLRTVFYATRNSDPENRQAFQGVARLVGYETGNNAEIMTGTSFFGGEACHASYIYQSLDDSFNREEDQTGTDIFIAGFNKDLSQNWETEVIKYAVDSFFYAIYHNKISLVAGGRELSKSTLQMVIDDIVCQSKCFPGHAEQYYKVLTSNSDKAKKFEKKITEPGRVGKLVLKLLVDDELTFRRIAMVRNTGMKIFDKKNICGSINFAGVLVVEGEELNHYLKMMEDATHESWSENNADNPTEARKFLKEIHNFCKESLNSLIEVQDGEEIDSGLGNFFPIDITADDDNQRNTVESINPTYRKISNEPERSRKKRKLITRNLEDDSDDNGGEDADEIVENENGDEMTGGAPSNISNEGVGGNQGGSSGNVSGNDPSEVFPRKIPVIAPTV